MIDIDDPQVRNRSLRLNARAEVRDVRLLSSSIGMERLPSQNSSLSYDLNSSPEVQYSPGDNFFVVEIAYELSIDDVAEVPAPPDDDDIDSTSIANFTFTLAALFALSMRTDDAAIEEDELEAYSLTTAQLLMYPYAREYIYDVTGRLGLPALTVGMLKMTTSPDN